MHIRRGGFIMAKRINYDDFKAQLRDDMTIMVGGFMATGSPEQLIDAILDSGVKDLTLIGNDTATATTGLGRLVAAGRVKHVICSHIGLNSVMVEKVNEGSITVDLVPQGTLAERIRAKGAGIGGFLTPTGVGTIVADGKDHYTYRDVEYIMEHPLEADLAIIRADRCDELGNCQFTGTTRNFNPIMAMAAEFVVCESEEIVALGKIETDVVMLPHIFIDYILEGGKIIG